MPELNQVPANDNYDEEQAEHFITSLVQGFLLLRAELQDQDDYLNMGRATSIAQGSIGHREIKRLLQETQELADAITIEQSSEDLEEYE